MRPALIATFFLLTWVLLATFFHSEWSTKETQLLEKDSLALKTSYQASVTMFRLATETLFEEVLQRPDVIETFAQGLRSESAERNRARGQLYRLLAPVYTHLKQKGIRQLQFHTATGYSYLRFFGSDKYGDSLFGIRPSVRIANTEKRAVASFEPGRTNTAFRYVFPLFQGDSHLGSVEISIPYNTLRNAMIDIDPNHDYALVIRRESVEAALFPEQRPLYETAPMHDDFLVEDPRLQLPDSPPPPPETIRDLNVQLKNDPRVQTAMATAQIFTLPIILENVTWAVSFLPIRNTLGQHVGCLISYAKSPVATSLRHFFFLSLGLGTLAIAGFGWFTWSLIRSRAQVREEKHHLLTITDTIAEGLYVTDHRGHITQVNPAFGKILGFRTNEILGPNGHELFHVHDDSNANASLNGCPLLSVTSTGKSYTGEELFRHKNGQRLAVEVSCHPILKNDLASGSVTAFRDITERKAAEERIRFLAQYDTLTGLPNRTLFQDRLQQAIARRPQGHERLALLFLDLDHFKTINDSLGHHIGDRLLQEAAARIASCLRGSDTVCRQGGDEFVIMLLQIKDPSAPAHIARKILANLAQPFRLEEHELRITGSIGIVLCPDDGNDAASLIKNADAAMYHAKKNGRDNYQFFTQELNVQAHERLSRANDLRRALERNEFLLDYQPRVDLGTGAIVGAEALLRWRHPSRGLLVSDQFFPAAEECGLIVPLGEWMLGEACRQWRQWQAAGLIRIPVSVKMTLPQSRRKNLDELLRKVLEESGLSANLLALELPEDMLTKDANNGADSLQRFRALGLNIVIGDFGTGYSALSHLKGLPGDKLKINRAFVRNIASDIDDAALASGIVAMAHRLRMKVIAEGVDTPEQRLFLLREGCDEAQGDHYSVPLSATDMEALLRRDGPLPPLAS